MKNAKSHVCCMFTLIALFFNHFVLAEESTSSTNSRAKIDAKMEEMIKKAEELGKPGDAHKALEPLVGDWDVEGKCWMDPSAPPTVSKGFAKATWILGGRYVQEEFNGEMMGKPFKGIGISGYDNMKQKYKSVWIDDMSTALVTSEGSSEGGGKVFTFTSRMDCPVTGEKDVPIKQVIRIISNDKHTFEMFDLRKEDNNKTMELTYTRK